MLSRPRRLPVRSRVARDPERTRAALLQAAFEQIYRSGFQGTDLDTILERSGVTKGALYHHFASKEALGYAVVDEVLVRLTHTKWLLPLETAHDPIAALIGVIRSTSIGSEEVRCGCPLNNLAQEMSPLDEGFRKRLARVFANWQEGIGQALRAGRKRGLVRKDVDLAEAATFLMATYEGYISLAKNSQDARLLQSGTRRMVRYLRSLRPASGTRRAGSRTSRLA